MSKYDILPDFECRNRILNVKIRYSAPFLMSKFDFYVKIRYSSPFLMSNRILYVKIRYSAPV